ncbi:MAG: ATP-binding cassette domain-containing protein [Gammaproteobacteria bacterium]|nr:ATP-binding cassette domain-containing protein [Gammaproteobacteria bacterium]
MTVGYDSRIIQQNLTFDVGRSEIFIIMGTSGCGKSTLMRSAIGLVKPQRGHILYQGESFWDAAPERRQELMTDVGVMYQSSALWSGLSLAENVTLPLTQIGGLDPGEADDIAELKLALVGLSGFEDYYPAEVSGGMRKRAAIARAIALDPQVLFLDEPSAGLDPISSRLLDDLTVQLRDSLGTTMIMVTHELPTILGIGDNSVFLDTETRTMLASGNPRRLKEECGNNKVRQFLSRSTA